MTILRYCKYDLLFFFFFQAEDGIRDYKVTGVQTCALPIYLEPLALMKALLLADAHHGTRVRAIGAAADGDLVHDRRAIDQPADRAHIRPGECRVVEYARILGAAGQQLLEHLRP